MNQQQLKERLLAEQCSCVIYNRGEVRIFRERGVKDLYRLLKEEPEFLAGASMADKVVGKAAAALLALGGVREVFALVISLPARITVLTGIGRIWRLSNMAVMPS